MRKLFFLLLATLLLQISCKSNTEPSKLVLNRDEKTSLFAYFDENGNKILGDYFAAYTDTITDFGIVADPGFVLINKKGKHIYNIFSYDNAPDYASEGIYRIKENGKIGYVDSLTSKIIVKPQFGCAFPFENGKAKVSFKCKTVAAFPGDEHPTWQSEEWFYIDKKGNIIAGTKM